MSSEASPPSATASTRAQLLDRLREHLESVERLTFGTRRALEHADAVAIDSATARLRTLFLEFKLMHHEYLRLPAEPVERSRDAEVLRARRELEYAALRIARSAAVGSGLLEQLIAMSRRLIAAASVGRGDPYLASGEAHELPAEGLRLEETV